MTVRYRIKSKTGKGKTVTHRHLYYSKNEADRAASSLVLRNPSRTTKAWAAKVVYKDKPPKVAKKTLLSRFPQEKTLPSLNQSLHGVSKRGELIW